MGAPWPVIIASVLKDREAAAARTDHTPVRVSPPAKENAGIRAGQ